VAAQLLEIEKDRPTAVLVAASASEAFLYMGVYLKGMFAKICLGLEQRTATIDSCHDSGGGK
jgi:hypothetical protein